MTDIECLQKLSTISGYCCAQKDKDALDHAMSFIKTAIDKSKSYWHGHWIDCDDSDDYSADGYDCSVCGCNESYATTYCPNCGARMLEEAAGDTQAERKEI